MKTVINFRWFFNTLIFAFLIAFGVYMLSEELPIPIFLIIIGVLLTSLNILLSPISITFSEKGIRINYCYCKIFSEWNSLKHIEMRNAGNGIFPWLSDYYIGYFETKNPLIRDAVIPKNRRTKAQIERYHKIDE